MSVGSNRRRRDLPRRGVPILPLTSVIALGGWNVLVDAIDGMTASGANLGTVTDLSGNGRTVNRIGLPTYSATKWGGVRPGVQFDGIDDSLTGAIASIAQPFGFFVVVSSFAPPAGQANLMTTDSAPGANTTMLYVPGGQSTFFAFASPNGGVNTAFGVAARRILIFNVDGANSIVYDSLVPTAALNLGNVATQTRWGLASDGAGGARFAACVAGAAGIRAGLFSAGDRETLVNVFSTRYPLA